MNRDIFLWVAIAGLVAVIAILFVLLRKKSHRSESSNYSSGSKPNIEQNSSDSSEPLIPIPKLAGEICVLFDLIRSSSWFSSHYSDEELLYILSYIYLYPISKQNIFGEELNSMATATAYLAQKESEKYGSSQLFFTVLRLTYICSAALSIGVGLDEKFSFDLSSQAVDHFRDEIEDIVNHYSPPSYTLSQLSKNAIPLWAYTAGFENTHPQYNLKECRKDAKGIVQQFEGNRVIDEFLSFFNSHKKDYDDYDY